ncbi:MAE_28990/MAE_18760 family HEPN-like nuclease [Tardiphaga robiniae]|uniref:MAE-28990/MAE-18760-like HEPN domain-containing protein n=1 Tax=Tardiphaga robiniae TaxID=943830 RepID=A0A7G6U822_9BRAD|nr:MAE_28990/MAE_18760 family HEPN-like nuclease [Tardiphaga robiniae]QND75154.1 hypothetical protein HB776_31030 [Tardiphaga robiniae]
MRSVDAVVGDLESDRLSREAELRPIERLAGAAELETERKMLKRSLVLLTYSHLEGFCRFAISTYVSALNSLGLSCEAATAAVAAAGMSDVFKALRDTNNKHPLFSRSLADDRAVHMVAREQIFVDRTREFFSQVINIPDALIETHYSLTTDVLRKLMFQVGLKTDEVEPRRGPIERLKHVRNAIAHGDRLKVPSDEDTAMYLSTAIDMIGFLQHEITFALTNETYLKPVESQPA